MMDMLNDVFKDLFKRFNLGGREEYRQNNK